MKYIDERNGEEKETNYLRFVIGETEFALNEEQGELLITKINFNDSTLVIRPNVSNQISIK